MRVRILILTIETPVPFVSSLNESVITVGQAFKQYFSINHSPKPSFFKYLARFTTNPTERDYLLDLCVHDENQTKLTDEIKKKYVTIVDILEKLKDVKMTFDQIADILPKMYPRYYSISSAKGVHENRLHITVGSLQIPRENGLFYGVCSNYITRLQVGDVVHGFIRPSLFKLPKDPMHPILIISGGTGIAPFIGFLEERQLLKDKGVKLGPAALFYGVRDENNVIHGKLLTVAFENGLISNLYIVYSDTENGKEGKMFVSDRVKQQGPLVWDFLKNGSNIYICGGVSGFGPSVYNSLKSVFDTHGDGSFKSEDFIANLKKMGRCFEDLAD
jgi:sulfite reductase alpha subunit-like flavoprotein